MWAKLVAEYNFHYTDAATVAGLTPEDVGTFNNNHMELLADAMCQKRNMDAMAIVRLHRDLLGMFGKPDNIMPLEYYYPFLTTQRVQEIEAKYYEAKLAKEIGVSDA